MGGAIKVALDLNGELAAPKKNEKNQATGCPIHNILEIAWIEPEC